MRFLLVDDNPLIRAILRRFLEQTISPIEAIDECGEGESALNLYDTYKPDWVLMDIQLPGMDGFEITRRIVRTDAEARIIIVSQFDDVSYREAATEAGARAFVSKENLHDLSPILSLKKSSC